MTLAELRAALNAALAALRSLHEEIGSVDPTDAQAARWDELTAARDAAAKAYDDALDAATRSTDQLGPEDVPSADVERQQVEETARVERMERVRQARSRFGGHRSSPAPTDDANLRYSNPMSISSTQVRSALLARMESRLSDMPTEAGSRFERTIRSLVNGAMGTDHEWQARQWQQRLLVRASAEYARAWSKYVSGQSFAITPEEARAIAVGTSTSGGYLVPTQLDPTVILTNDGATDVVRELVAARGGVRTMLPGTGNQWNGITSAGVTASWDAEGSAVSDDSPEFDKEGIPIKSARAWVEATFQSLINISGLESDLYGMFADAKNRLESATHCTGAGSSTVPEGIVTALVAATTRQIVSTTAAEIGVVDINKVHRTLGQRWRGRGSWLMNPLYADAIQALGTDVGVAYSGSIVGDYASTLKNRPWRVSDDMPDTQTTNTKDPEVIFGDWAGYVIVDRPGTMAVEFVPNVMDPSTGRPISTRGWLCWWEEGAGLFTPESFLMLVDKTTT